MANQCERQILIASQFVRCNKPAVFLKKNDKLKSFTTWLCQQCYNELHRIDKLYHINPAVSEDEKLELIREQRIEKEFKDE